MEDKFERLKIDEYEVINKRCEDIMGERFAKYEKVS